ncbi:MAG: hypothetical protein C7B46_18680 [Sulfobacillus benefaciens]|uniref:Transposase n=1 Tax=Sulfobacillus benefaciens TaxID=453960 RepID=A0A2T2X489_9FIRM|nr:MAG: hypothetical protein C7B46_18680 [Sulfobacillus benefaciens]
MLTAATGRPVYLACGPTDLRKSIDALAALVQLTFHRDPCSSALFVFCNRDRTKLKILEWDDAGFWLLSRIRDNNHYAEKLVMPKFCGRSWSRPGRPVL